MTLRSFLKACGASLLLPVISRAEEGEEENEEPGIPFGPYNSTPRFKAMVTETDGLLLSSFKDAPNTTLSSVAETLERLLNALEKQRGGRDTWLLRWKNIAGPGNLDGAHGFFRVGLALSGEGDALPNA